MCISSCIIVTVSIIAITGRDDDSGDGSGDGSGDDGDAGDAGDGGDGGDVGDGGDGRSRGRGRGRGRGSVVDLPPRRARIAAPPLPPCGQSPY